MKVVINRKYGGYGLSEAAALLLAEKKGLTITITKSEFGSTLYWTEKFWEGRWEAPLTHRAFMKLSKEEQELYLTLKQKAEFRPNDVERHDDDLVAVVEELGELANTEYSNLVIYNDFEGYEIDEYDGMERII